MDKKQILLVIFATGATLIGLVRIVTDTFASSCLFSLTASVLLPIAYIFVVNSIPDDLHSTENYKRLSGTLVGFLGITSFLVVGNIQYYFLDGRSQVYAALGRPTPPLTIEVITGGLLTNVPLWLFWIAMSSLVSYISTKIFDRKAN